MNKFLIVVLALLALSAMAFRIKQGSSAAQGPPAGQGPPSDQDLDDYEPTEEELAYLAEHEEEIEAAQAEAQAAQDEAHAEAQAQAEAAGLRLQNKVGSVNYH